MLIRLLTWLGLVEGIILIDYMGDIYLSKTTKNYFDENKKSAFVYPFAKIGHITLNPDGTVDNSYIEQWRYLRKKFDPVKEANNILNQL